MSVFRNDKLLDKYIIFGHHQNNITKYIHNTVINGPDENACSASFNYAKYNNII